MELRISYSKSNKSLWTHKYCTITTVNDGNNNNNNNTHFCHNKLSNMHKGGIIQCYDNVLFTFCIDTKSGANKSVS